MENNQVPKRSGVPLRVSIYNDKEAEKEFNENLEKTEGLEKKAGRTVRMERYGPGSYYINTEDISSDLGWTEKEREIFMRATAKNS